MFFFVIRSKEIPFLTKMISTITNEAVSIPLATVDTGNNQNFFYKLLNLSFSNVSPMSPFGQPSAEPSPSSSQFGLSSLGLEKLALNMMPKSSNTTVGMKGGNRDYQLITGGAHHGHHHMGASNQKQPIQPYGGQAYWQTN